jgi:hypothetical protein
MSSDERSESDAERMTDEEIREFLRREGAGVLGFSTAEAPYLLPMSFGYDGQSALYFVFLLFGAGSRKAELADETHRASFLVYRTESKHAWRSVQAVGRLEAVADGEWSDFRTAMENAWHPDVFSSARPTRGIDGYRLEIADWTGVHHE